MKNGWVVMSAPDESTAAETADKYFSDAWSYIYHQDDFDKHKHYFPHGEIGEIVDYLEEY